MTFGIIAVYVMILFGSQRRIQKAIQDFSRRFPQIWSVFGLVLLFLFFAAANGIMTFGLSQWKAPFLSLFVYLAPLPGVALGYMYVDEEERLVAFFRFYSVLTAVALVGTILEYYRVDSRSLGMVRQVGDYIRYLPGIQVRMLSGFYRAPDIMGWHAAMLTCIAIGMMVRAEMQKRSWLWMVAAGWGFYNCMISGRRKAVYFVAAFALAFVFSYFRRLKAQHVASTVLAALVIAFVVHQLRSDEQGSAYAVAAATTSGELGGRLEGGLMETIRQFGILGAGLGVATQGVQHVLERDMGVSWQEGGLGKLAVELGLPGLMAAALLAWKILRTTFKIASIPDYLGSTQIVRVMLFALMIANVANFLASAQTYSDPVITIMTCFLVGALFATVTLDEPVPRSSASTPPELAPLPA